MHKTEPASLDPETRAMVRRWIAQHRGDTEALARWMRDRLRIGGLRECRALIAAAEGEAANA